MMRFSSVLAILVLLTVATGLATARRDTGSLIAKTGGKGTVVVFLEPAGAERFDAAPADGAAITRTSSEDAPRVSLDQKDLIFVPHILAIEEGTVVDVLNSDDCSTTCTFTGARPWTRSSMSRCRSKA